MTKIKWIILLIFIFFTALVVYLFISFEIKYSNSFYPGISIAGEKVDGKNYLEVSEYFKNKLDLINKNGVTFNIEGFNGKKEVIFPTFSKGLTSDKVVEHYSLNNWEDTIKSAYSIGRKGSIWQKIKEQCTSYFKKINFVFSPIIQKETVDSFFKDELEDFLLKTSPSEFIVKNNEVSISTEVIGEKIDSTKIINALEKKLVLMDNSPTNLKTDDDIPFSTNKKLTLFLNSAENIKNNITILFKYNNYTWKVKGDNIVTWLTVKQDDKIGINEKKLEYYFNKTVILYIDSPMKNAHFEMRSGKLVEISPGKAGNVVDIKKNTQNVENAILDMVNNKDASTINNNINIQIETTVEEPRITQETIDKYKIKELVGSATTNFEGGSLDRQKNIEVGVSKLNGILLAPGEEFSAVDAIGEITEEAGFVKEYVISEGKTQKELGGGLCQLATTLFRLALDSGLQIVERVNHRYVISYYGAGLDATIYGPHPDLRFINDTDNYLLLQGKTVNNEVVFEFYGKKDGREVEISKPVLYNIITPPLPKYIPTYDLPLGKTKCSEIPHNGITADATYTVTYASGNIEETKFHSVYQPWQKVCLIGIGK
ncbi:MAG: VanW family protein [Candidatus Staskawiczbacteria bacterium]